MMNTYFGTVDAWLAIIRGEYVEVPGLQLTRDQVKRMWTLDDATCTEVLNKLVREQFLKLTSDSRYAWSGNPTVRSVA
jgi:hypothetical protein